MSRLLFLDFDGVLRSTTSDPSRLEAHCVHAFENSVSELRRHFSPDIRERIFGVTPDVNEWEQHARFEEIKAFLQVNRFQETPWVAVDDQPDLFPRAAPVLIVEGKVSFTDRDGELLAKVFNNR